jgi:hypothetical protein
MVVMSMPACGAASPTAPSGSVTSVASGGSISIPFGTTALTDTPATVAMQSSGNGGLIGGVIGGVIALLVVIFCYVQWQRGKNAAAEEARCATSRHHYGVRSHGISQISLRGRASR